MVMRIVIKWLTIALLTCMIAVEEKSRLEICSIM